MNADDSIRAARALLPWWTLWRSTIVLPIAAFPLAWIGARILVWLFARPLEREPAAHWTVRAEHLHRMTIGLVTWVLTLVFLDVIVCLRWRHPLAPIPDGGRMLLVMTSVVLAVNMVSRPLRRRFGGLAGNRTGVKSESFRGAFGAGIPVLVAVVLASLLPARPSPIVLVAAILATAGAIALSIGLGIRLGHRRGHLRHASLRERDLVAGVERIHVFDVRAANAIAFPLLGEIGVTQPALEILDRDELAAVLRHEVGHLREHKAQSWLRVLPSLFLLALGWWHPIAASFGLLVVAVLYVMFVLSAIVLKRCARRAEQDADHHASHGESPAYARALEKLHEWNLARVSASKRATHPGLYERMVAAGVTPSWSPPQTKFTQAPMYVMFTVMLLTFFVLRHRAPFQPSGDRAEVLARLAVGGHDADYLTELGRIEEEAGRDDKGLVFYRGASAADERAPWAGIDAVILLARGGRCEEARAELDEAQRRFNKLKNPGHGTEWMRSAIEAVKRCR